MAIQYKPSGVDGVKITEGVPNNFYERILTSGFFTLLRDVERATRGDRGSALWMRALAQEEYDRGAMPRYRAETKDLRTSDWKTEAERPGNLLYQYAELVTPVSIPNRIKRGFDAITKNGPHINGHYAALLFADGEDAEGLNFVSNILSGQLNLHLALRNELEVKGFPTQQIIPTVKYRPRGMHLDEVHVLVDDKPVSATAFDLSLFYLSNVHQLLGMGSKVNDYIPKLETPEDARYVNKLQNTLEDMTSQPRGTFHTSLIIETAPALVHMHEFAWELRQYIGEFSFGRYDMLFHIQKTFRNHPDKIMPDEQYVSMDSPFLALAQAAMVDVCYRRGIYPQGGMEAWVPQKDRKENAKISELVREGAKGELGRHMTGKWILHPDSLSDIITMFMAGMNGKPIHDYHPSGMLPSEHLLFNYPTGLVTQKDTNDAGYFALGYLADLFGGAGASQMRKKMFDAAVLEIQAAKISDRLRKGPKFDDTNQPATLDGMIAMLTEQRKILETDGKNPENLAKAQALLERRLKSNSPGEHVVKEAYEVMTG